ncbi:MAG: outer membrane protein [Planctomycetia bacterium]
MKRIIVWSAFFALVAAMSAAARAGELGQEIDLTTFGKAAEPAARSSVWDSDALEEVGLFDRGGRANRRFYASGMIGPQFLGITESSVLNQTYDSTVFSAGGAAGVAFDRTRGYLRLELEGVWRDDGIAIADNGGTPVRLAANNGWSVMQNVWRDLLITDRFGVYGGGGLGGGGYTLGVGNESHMVNATFAWQFGGGLIYELSDRLTFDVGYRYFQIPDVTNTTSIGDLTTLYGASELMFTLRLYDPLRRWRQ